MIYLQKGKKKGPMCILVTQKKRKKRRKKPTLHQNVSLSEDVYFVQH